MVVNRSWWWTKIVNDGYCCWIMLSDAFWCLINDVSIMFNKCSWRWFMIEIGSITGKGWLIMFGHGWYWMMSVDTVESLVASKLTSQRWLIKKRCHWLTILLPMLVDQHAIACLGLTSQAISASVWAVFPFSSPQYSIGNFSLNYRKKNTGAKKLSKEVSIFKNMSSHYDSLFDRKISK